MALAPGYWTGGRLADRVSAVDFEDRRAREAFRYSTVSTADKGIMNY